MKRPADLLSIACLAASVACVAIIAVMAWNGTRLIGVVPPRNPLLYFALAVATGLGHYALRFGGTNTRRDWAWFAGRATLVALGLALSALMVEVGLRVLFAWQIRANDIERLKDYQQGKIRVKSSHPLAYIITPSTDRNLVYELRPNLDMDFGHKRVRTNRDGMRDIQDYSAERQPHSVRIVGVGDSGMFGWNVEQDEDYLSVLRQRLAARGDGVRYEVLNFAVPGYNTELETEMVAARGLAFHPDVVIVGWNENDFQPSYFVLEKKSFWRTDVSFLDYYLFYRDQLGALFENPIRDLRSFTERDVPDSFAGSGGDDEVVHALTRLQGLARTHGFHFLVFGPMKQRVVDICRRLGVDYYSLFEQIPRDAYPKSYAVHFMHPSKEGHRALAEHLERVLEERGWLKPTLAPSS